VVADVVATAAEADVAIMIAAKAAATNQ